MQNDNDESQEVVDRDDHDQNDSVADLGSNAGSPDGFQRDNQPSDSDDESMTDNRHYMESQFMRGLQELRAQLATSMTSRSTIPLVNQSMTIPSFRPVTGRKSMHHLNLAECDILQRAHELTTPDLS
jgi:hypothetical protein